MVSMADKREPTQRTQPKGKDKTTGQPHEPVEIPVPKREDVVRDLKRVAKTKKTG